MARSNWFEYMVFISSYKKSSLYGDGVCNQSASRINAQYFMMKLDTIYKRWYWIGKYYSCWSASKNEIYPKKYLEFNCKNYERIVERFANVSDRRITMNLALLLLYIRGKYLKPILVLNLYF
jgi:hypothetical protein